MRKNSAGFLVGIQYIKDRILGLLFPQSKKGLSYNSSRSSKAYLTGNDSLFINGKTKLKTESINQSAKNILKQNITDPEALLKFIASKGTPVIRAPHIEKVLILIGENEGFVLPTKGLKALFLITMVNILSPTKLGLGLSTPAMFIMRNETPNMYYFAHQFYHWLAYSKGLPGYEEETMNNFKNIWSPEFSSTDIDRMSLDEILSLKDAIARDVEAIKLVKELSREIIGSKNSLNKLKNGESVNL